MTIEKIVIIESPIEKAWQLLGPDFAQSQRWASAVSHSEGRGEGFNGATCSERGCSTTIGELKEKLLEYDPSKYTLAYEIPEGMPSMVRTAFNKWQLQAINAVQTRLIMGIEIEVQGFWGKLLQPMMRLQMSNLAGQIVEEFKFYVENGKPHPRKVKAQEQLAALKPRAVRA